MGLCRVLHCAGSYVHTNADTLSDCNCYPDANSDWNTDTQPDTWVREHHSDGI